MLPSGTRIKYGDSDVTYETVKNTSSIFYYKDGLSDTSYELMNINNNTRKIDILFMKTHLLTFNTF